MIFIFLSSDPSIGSGTKSVLNKKAFTAESTSSALSNWSFLQPCQSCWKRYCHSNEDRHSKTFLIFIIFFYLWWILSYNEMKQPWVYMCSPSQSLLPPPSPPTPPRFSQCTRSERLSHASNLGWWSVSP